MRFSLLYRGPLKANGSPSEKHDLRKTFHKQLSVLWSQTPLSSEPELLKLNSDAGRLSVIRTVGGRQFAPLVCECLALVCELDITFLRPGSPGRLISQGGDIDNRIKTLLDGLRMPRLPKELPACETTDHAAPFFCLLEDDSLVTRINVDTDRLLEADATFTPNSVHR